MAKHRKVYLHLHFFLPNGESQSKSVSLIFNSATHAPILPISSKINSQPFVSLLFPLHSDLAAFPQGHDSKEQNGNYGQADSNGGHGSLKLGLPTQSALATKTISFFQAKAGGGAKLSSVQAEAIAGGIQRQTDFVVAGADDADLLVQTKAKIRTSCQVYRASSSSSSSR